MKVISVNRGKKSEALKDMAHTARQQYKDGRQIVIYPEGTRKFVVGGCFIKGHVF